jgi:hypothetical protein
LSFSAGSGNSKVKDGSRKRYHLSQHPTKMRYLLQIMRMVQGVVRSWGRSAFTHAPPVKATISDIDD